jgi:hypothetical protein
VFQTVPTDKHATEQGLNMMPDFWRCGGSFTQEALHMTSMMEMEASISLIGI